MSVGDVILGSMDHSARITAFTGLVGPPPGPAPAVDWAAVEGWLGTPLPGDYKALVSAYGAAEIGGPGAAIRLHPPCVSTDGRFEYAAWIVETHRHSAIRPGMFTARRRPFLPEEGGLLAFATTRSGDHLLWNTGASDDPDEWPVTLMTTNVAVGVSEPWVDYEVPFLELLFTLLRTGVPHPGEPGGLLGPLSSQIRVWPPLAGAAPWSPPPAGTAVDARQHAALTEGSGLDAVMALVPPPLEPYLGEGTWEQVFERLGTRLPPDFVALAERYGAGNWSWWLDMSAPLSLDRPREQGLAATVEGMLDGYRQLRAAHPQYYPMPAWPEPGGFLPFASTIDGDQIGWCADGPPETWRVAVNPRHCDQGPPLPGDFTATLLTWLRGGPAESGFPGLTGRDLHPLDVMFFEPFGPGAPW